MQSLLGELQGIEGTATVCGALSYTSQEPWIFSGTLRENILFGSPHVPDHYDEVIRACSLDEVSIFMCDVSAIVSSVHKNAVQAGVCQCLSACFALLEVL